MKLIIAGGRDFIDYNNLHQTVWQLYGDDTITEIVSGTANGADKLGERFADAHGITVKRLAADWELHGKSAGHIRNGSMARYADELLAFWDGDVKNSGTFDMITQMNNLKKPVTVVMYKPHLVERKK
jgi:hypothetical protein